MNILVNNPEILENTILNYPKTTGETIKTQYND